MKNHKTEKKGSPKYLDTPGRNRTYDLRLIKTLLLPTELLV